MKILLVGSLNFRSSPFQYAEALKDLGHDVRAVSDTPRARMPGLTGGPGLYDRLRIKFGYPRDCTGANRTVRRVADSFNPDIIWCIKTLTLRPPTLQSLVSDTDATLVFSAGDNMAKEHNHSKYFLKGLKHYDAVFKTRGYAPDFYRNHGVEDLFDFDLGYSERLMFSRRSERPYIYDVAFIGSHEHDRHQYLRALSDAGITVHVWGNGWPSDEPSKSLRIHDRPVYGSEYVATMHDAKICLNFYRKLNEDVMNSRVFEIPAAETFMLSERTEPPFTFFEQGTEADYFESKQEAIEKVQYYLSNPEERRQAAVAGRQRCLDDGYYYRSRLRSMLDALVQNGLVTGG